MPTIHSPTISDVERIAALPDPVLRNLQITQCYHELALALMERTGWNANWCTFATWASKQAGQTIRKEDLGQMLEQSLGSEGAALLAAQDLKTATEKVKSFLRVDDILGLIWKAYDPQSAFERSSSAVARGNLKVFGEIAHEFARFHADCLLDPVYDEVKLARFSEQLRPGEPPDGQRFLRQAFMHYYQALYENDEKSRIELMLFANLEIGLHEQIRLQPEIVEALTAPVISPQLFAHNLLEVLFPHSGWLTKVGWFFLRLFGRLRDFDAAIEAVLARVKRLVQYIVTDLMMTIEMPHNKHLHLGDDLVELYPPSLRQLTHPELRDLLSRIDPTPDSTRESGAEYWGDLDDRIHFIADMFRCYEVSPDMLEAPFSVDQTRLIEEGHIPPGRL